MVLILMPGVTVGGDLWCVWCEFCPEGGSIEWSVLWAGAWSFVSPDEWNNLVLFFRNNFV